MGRTSFSGPAIGPYVIAPLRVAGTLITVDGAGSKFVAPFDCQLVHAGASLHSTGASSGQVDIMLSDGSDDYLDNPMVITYDDSDGATFTTTFAIQAISQGDVVQVDIDAAPGNGAADLDVVLTLYTTDFALVD